MLYNPITVAVLWAGFWLPQIIHNIATGCSMKVDRIVCFLTTVQLMFPMYIMICPSNLFDLEPNTYWAKCIIVFVILQIFVMYLQNRWGARLFVPKTVWAIITKLYLYVGSYAIYDNIEWAIWLDVIDISSIVYSSSDIYWHIYIMQWGHIFHYDWMKRWIKNKVIWPLWRWRETEFNEELKVFEYR